MGAGIYFQERAALLTALRRMLQVGLVCFRNRRSPTALENLTSRWLLRLLLLLLLLRLRLFVLGVDVL